MGCSWTNDTLSLKRTDVAAIGLGHLAFFAGGNSANGLTDRIDIFDARNNSWTRSQLSMPRSEIAAGAAGIPFCLDPEIVEIDLFDRTGDTVLFAGGVSNYDLSESRVDVLHVVSNTWNVTALSNGGRLIPSTSTKDLIFFYTGSIYTSPKVEIYRVANDSNYQVPHSPNSNAPTYHTPTVNQPYSVTPPSVRTNIAALQPRKIFYQGSLRINVCY